MTLSQEKEVQSESEERKLLREVRAIHSELLELIDYDKMHDLQGDLEKIRVYLCEEIETILSKKKKGIPEEKKQLITEYVLDEILGFGPAEQLLRDETVTDIFINGPNEIFVERRGKVEKSSICFINDDHIFRLVQRVASKSGRHLDLGTPYLDAQLPDGSRLNAIIPPIAISGIKVSIRKFLFRKLWLDTLVEGGALTEEMARFLSIAVQSRFNIVICGGTGSGKTTLMNSLFTSIRSGERVITIEDTPELQPSHEHFVRLVTRAPNPEGKGGVSQADLMINALRMRPDRVILGELRGPEAFNLLHAMNTGQDGSMVTLHASGTDEVVPRLLNMILMARYALSAESVTQQIAGALDLVVNVSRLVDGSRRVMAIAQVSPGEGRNAKIEFLYQFKISKISAEGVFGDFVKHHPPPPNEFINKFTTSGLIEDYYSIFPKQQGDSSIS